MDELTPPVERRVLILLLHGKTPAEAGQILGLPDTVIQEVLLRVARSAQKRRHQELSAWYG